MDGYVFGRYLRNDPKYSHSYCFVRVSDPADIIKGCVVANGRDKTCPERATY